ncbi:sensor histidine kinase [Spirosoma spitsbergense]|uniref:sensor histidine kinase n=1 Tax=Spirosoma spitsbergense TaxID=431554 RepID=UPI00037FBE0D|nr:sensor histidine kinase [Spirosoma spitsbergense]
MRYARTTLCFLLACLTHVQIVGKPTRLSRPEQEDEPITFEHYGQESGLSQGTINAVTAYDGFRWFATQDGLNRFDGYGFRVYRIGQGLNSNLVQALLTDSHQRLWIGTGAGLNLFDRAGGRIRGFTETFGIRHAVDSLPVNRLLEDKRGRIWIQTVAQGLFCFDPALKKIRQYFPGINTIHSCCLAPDGQLWVLTFNELYRYDTERATFVAVPIRQRLTTASLFQNLLFDKRGNLWMGTADDGAFRLENPASPLGHVTHYVQGGTARHLSGNDVESLLCDKTGNVWIGTRTGGIAIYHPETDQFTYVRHSALNRRSLRENFVWLLYQDQQDIVWVGSSSQGIDKYDPNRLPFGLIQQQADNPAQGLPDNVVFRLLGLGNQLYIGTEAGGFARYSIPDGAITSFPETAVPSASAMHGEVRVINADSNGNLWFANWHELTQYDPRQNRAHVYPMPGPRKQKYIFAAHMLSDTNGRTSEIWVAGDGGLMRFDWLAKRWKGWQDLPAVAAISAYYIRLVYQQERDIVWFGTLGNGLLRYNRRTQQLNAFGPANGLACLNIRSVLQDGCTLWVGTDCGLFVLDLTRNVVTRQYTSSKGPMAFRLPNDVIYGILKDNEGYLWLSSNQGLTRFSPTKGVLKNYDVSDGLQSNEFNTNVAYKHADGTLFFGGVNGVTYVRTGQMQRNAFVPPIRITALTVLDSAYNPNQTRLTLNPDQNFIEFSFAALNFSNSQKNRYQYKLEGIDASWVQAQHRRTANYTNLPPGNYVFRVKGSNDDGLWNEQGTLVNILIKPPFWATLWFRIAMLMLLAGGLYGGYLYRIATLKNRQAHELSVAIRTQELERHRFSKELHDGVGANLAVLKMYLSSLGSPNVTVDDVRNRSLSVLKSSIADIRSIIHDTHPRSLAEFGLVHTIDDVVALMNESHQLNVMFTCRQVPQKLPESIEINMFRIVQELLQNAAKHAEATHVLLSLNYEADTLSLTYSDDGHGFDPTRVHNHSLAGNGLININQRVMLVKGTYQLTSADNKGTAIRISVPVA